MFMMPTIDMVATGKNIERLRKVAGLSVRDLQDVLVLQLRRQFTSGSTELQCQRLIIW